MTADVDRLVDAFAIRINSDAREPLLIDEVPEALRFGEDDDLGYTDWRMVPADMSSLVETLEARLGRKLPPALRSLIGRYAFPSFETGGIRIFGNSFDGSLHYEMRRRIFSDEVIYRVLSANGFLQFGLAEGGSYDPVCIACRSGKAEESGAPIVRLDHEAMLLCERIRMIETIAGSLELWLERCVEAK